MEYTYQIVHHIAIAVLAVAALYNNRRLSRLERVLEIRWGGLMERVEQLEDEQPEAIMLKRLKPESK